MRQFASGVSLRSAKAMLALSFQPAKLHDVARLKKRRKHGSAL